MKDWRIRPTLIEEWDESIDYIMAIDENGTTDLEEVRNLFNGNIFDLFVASNSQSRYKHDRWFTISGVIMDRDNFPSFRHSINLIKYAYWQDGIFKYKQGERRVVFHSRDIRKREGPFNPKLIDYPSFINDISTFIQNQNFEILSASIDKIKHITTYSRPFHVYNLCLDFIVERFCRKLNYLNKDGILVLEARGKREDAEILRHLVRLLDNGNNFHNSEHFNRIKGVYFNPKWCFTKNNGKASYVILELADLVSFPIHKFIKLRTKDLAFTTLEPKLLNYPNYIGYGIKEFPR